MSGSTSERDALAADLLADLATPAEPPATPAAPRRPRSARPTPAPAAEVDAEMDGPRMRGPALQTVLRLEPFDWYKPLLRVHWLSVSMRVGPVYGQLGIRRAGR